ncbi:glucuronate isomerase [Staphylococcus petrasii]|uniref:glucuronate isomerase n=1 Tax=Staphylococcus petrasii TaxID=1276936 RepID=UPI001F59616F|nr:glucuronate isomerase [Staphylococcus petrasii]MCI2774393.1 glucuronate isomerase [Staphylococcus petrasii]
MSFINKDFMLNNETGKKLYHDIAKDMPIYDFHCHLDPKQIAEDVHFNDIVDIWLSGDHYKWRAMRGQGIEEYYITGDASNKEKFIKWAETLENSVGNPLYHWSHLELKMYFNIDEILTANNAERIYEEANRFLADNHITTQSLITDSNVKVICTTDNPTDSLEYHDEIAKQDDFKTAVLPAFRPDDVFKIGEEAFINLIKKLENVENTEIKDEHDFVDALHHRIDYFHSKGAKLADHGISILQYEPYTAEDITKTFINAINQSELSNKDKAQFQTFILNELSKKYYEKGWAMQIHFGALRNANTKMFEKLGPDTGFDSITDQEHVAYHLNSLLNLMEYEGHLPKTIIYNLNPTYNDIVGSAIANFQTEAGVKGKIQHGAGWWFNDTKRGMIRQMSSLADQGLLMNFVGMLTDSRSFISYSRHDYFRRILCTFIGDFVERGEIPNDEDLLRKLIENICYNNAYRYFNLI